MSIACLFVELCARLQAGAPHTGTLANGRQGLVQGISGVQGLGFTGSEAEGFSLRKHLRSMQNIASGSWQVTARRGVYCHLCVSEAGGVVDMMLYESLQFGPLLLAAECLRKIFEQLSLFSLLLGAHGDRL